MFIHNLTNIKRIKEHDIVLTLCNEDMNVNIKPTHNNFENRLNIHRYIHGESGSNK